MCAVCQSWRGMCCQLLWPLIAFWSARPCLAGNSITCIENTGGSCLINDCHTWRGNTRCDTGRCFCGGGTCSGVDEVCYDTSHADVPYPQIKSKSSDYGTEEFYEIQNARWPNYFLYVQVTGAVWASKDHDGDTSDFTIRKPPQNAGVSTAYSPPSYLVYSRKWTNAPVYVVMTQSDNDRIYAPACHSVEGGLGGLLADPPIGKLTLTFTRAPPDVQLKEMLDKNQSLVMLSSPAYPHQYIYLSTTGWAAKAYQNDPGAGGYWYIKTLNSVPLPKAILDAMPAYTGKRCSMFCGKAQAKAHSAKSFSYAVFVALWATVTMSLTAK